MFKHQKTALIAGSLLLIFSLVVLAGSPLALAEENDFDELGTLSFKMEGTWEEKQAEFWYRFKNIGTEKELFRMDATVLETEKTMSLILAKENETAFIKQMGSKTWHENSMMFSRSWDQARADISNLGSVEDWHEWAKQEEHIIEDEEHSVRVWDIKVDEPIEDSVFNP